MNEEMAMKLMDEYDNPDTSMNRRLEIYFKLMDSKSDLIKFEDEDLKYRCYEVMYEGG